MSDEPLICHRCSAVLRPGRGEHWAVRIEAVADPYPPVIREEDLDRDIGAEMARLAEALEGVSGQEAMDQVRRRMTITLCNECFRQWIENPAG